jgi:syntaxin-binding protein 1
MAQECMSLFEKRKLPQTADIEQVRIRFRVSEDSSLIWFYGMQCCATGVTAEGKTPKTLVEEMVPLLADNAVS